MTTAHNVPPGRRIALLELAAKQMGGKAALGRALGYADGAFVGQMLRGDRPVTEKTVAALAEVRGLQPLILGFSASAAENIERTDAFGRIPLVSWVRAGEWCEAHAADEADEWLPCPTRHGPNTFALRVVGDSMDGPGGYREGEIIFVDPGIAATPGRDVVARTPDGRVTFKRLKEDEGGQYLLALNTAWPERIIRVPLGTVICGVVIGSFTQR